MGHDCKEDAIERDTQVKTGRNKECATFYIAVFSFGDELAIPTHSDSAKEKPITQSRN
jgi:hypothetical protein